MDVQNSFPTGLAEYEKNIKEKLTPEKLQELERINSLMFNSRQCA